MYGLMTESRLRDGESFTSGIISFKKLNQGIFALQKIEGIGKNKQTWNPTKEDREEFEINLTGLIQQIFNTNLTYVHN